MQSYVMWVLVLLSMSGQTGQPPAPGSPLAGQARAEEYRELLAMYQSAIREIVESGKQDDATRKLFQKGVIRFKDLRDKPLDEAVDQLLGEARRSPVGR